MCFLLIFWRLCKKKKKNGENFTNKMIFYHSSILLFFNVQLNHIKNFDRIKACLHPRENFVCNSKHRRIYLYSKLWYLPFPIFTTIDKQWSYWNAIKGREVTKTACPLFVATWLEFTRSLLQTYRVRTIILPFKISIIIDFLLEDATKEIGN